MKVLVAVLVILSLGMGYTTYVAWHKGQEQAVAMQIAEDELNGLRKEKVRLADENIRLKTTNTTAKAQLLEAIAAIEEMRNTPTLTNPQLAHPLRKR